MKNGPAVVAGLLVLGLSVGLVGTAEAAADTVTETVTLAPGEEKTGTISCEPGRFAGVSSQATNASTVQMVSRDALKYTARAASRAKPGQVVYTLTCSD